MLSSASLALVASPLARHGIEGDAGRQIALGNVVADEVEDRSADFSTSWTSTVDVGQAEAG